MTSAIHRKHHQSIDRAVQALQTQPPRVRTALTELRNIFTDSGENPPAILAACATLLNTDAATSGDVLAAVRNAHAEWDSYGEQERELFTRCVYTSQTRRDVAVTDVNDVTAMLRETPRRIADALNGLRWLNAQTNHEHQATFIVCATLLKNPSVDHPAIVDAIQTAHDLWPTLTPNMRTLVTACVHASKARAERARARAAAQQQAIDAGTQGVTAETREPHRCGSCDGNLADTPDLPYCSNACRREAESAQLPRPDEDTAAAAEPTTAAEATTAEPQQAAPAAHDEPATTAKPRAKRDGRKAKRKAAHEPIEQKAARRHLAGEVEAEYDEQWRQIQQAIPSAGIVRKNESGVDAYEQERQRHRDTDTSRELISDLTGHQVSEDDYDRIALRPVAPGGLCTACNLERAVIEQRAQTSDDRCELCRDRDMPPLSAFAPTRELAAVA
ncbi:hypothetical protein ACIOD2_47430 [Amycolatopsis sp. NPDC088138]|uniref:hypothetical protein n=1 Tax=Amycolatopsis sp. NPDC088138 TaxID=3363938 RepID=UPI0038011A3E